MGTTFGQFVSRSGQMIDPEPNYFLDIGEKQKLVGLTRQCLNYIGISQEELSRIDAEGCMPQALTPQTRLTVLEAERFASEMNREFGKEQSQKIALSSALKQTEAEFFNYWNELPKRLTLAEDQKKLSKGATHLIHLQKKLTQNLKLENPQSIAWISGHTKSSELGETIGRTELQEVFSGLWHFATQNYNFDPELFSLLHLLSISRTGATFKGGMTAYRAFLTSLAVRNGAHIPPKTECRRIFIERGRFAGIQITTRGSMISTAGGVLGCSLDKIYSKATYTGHRWFRKKKESLQPVGWRFTLGVSVHKEAIPVGIMRRAVWKEKDAPPLEIETVQPADYELRSPDERIVFLRTIAPYTSESLSPEYQRLLSARMLRQAMEVLPFLEYHIVKIFPDFRFQETMVDHFTEAYGFASLDLIPDNLLVYPNSGLGSLSGIDGLFLASEESYPEWGSMGGIVAALEGISWLSHRLGFAGPMGKV
jgi:hypothetical protein